MKPPALPQEKDPSIGRHIRLGLAVVVVLLGGMSSWAVATKLAGAVIAPGTLVVENNVKKVQHPTGGVVKELRVKDGDSYVLVGSQGGLPEDPVWVHNLRADANIELRDETVVRPMRVREVKDAAERARLWSLAVAAYPPYADYQARTTRQIPVFVAAP